MDGHAGSRPHPARVSDRGRPGVGVRDDAAGREEDARCGTGRDFGDRLRSGRPPLAVRPPGTPRHLRAGDRGLVGRTQHRARSRSRGRRVGPPIGRRPRRRGPAARLCRSVGGFPPLDRRAPVLRHEPGRRPGVLRRRDDGGAVEHPREDPPTAGRGADLVVRLQGPGQGPAGDRPRTWCPVRGGGERPEAGRSAAHHRAAGGRGRQLPPVVGFVRPHAGRRVRHPGRNRGGDCRGAAGVAGAGRGRRSRGPAGGPRGVRHVPDGPGSHAGAGGGGSRGRAAVPGGGGP